jgi:hypothetical protein
VTAVIPAAGLGTRMLEITGGRAKELLPLGGRAVIERVILEAKTECDRIVVVASPSKLDLIEHVEELGAEVVIQSEMRGFAHAIGCAAVEGDMIVLLGDCAINGESPIERMANLLHKGVDGAIALQEVSEEDVSLYGIVEIGDLGGIRRIVEKPPVESAPSRFAICARYAFSGPLTAFVNQAAEVWDGPGELGLTPVLNAAIQIGFDIKAVPLPPNSKRADVGSPEQYQEARWWAWE